LPVSDLELLRDGAMAAGEIARRHFKSSPEIWDKGSGLGPVTEADLEINKMLCAELTSSRPDYGWLSEESEDSTNRLSCERVFIIDPIDGTRSFINGSTTFAHSLAVADHGEITVAVVYLPLLDKTYVARRGHGAYLNGERINCATVEHIESARVLAAKSQMNPDLWKGGVPPFDRHFRSSLAYRMCLVADGEFNAMLTLRDAWEWDIAAGVLMCQESGAVVSDRLRAPLRFNNAHPQTAGVIAAAHPLHDRIVERL